MDQRSEGSVIRTRLRAIPTEEYFSIVKQQLADLGYAQVRVTGVSMMPNLRHLTDAVVIVPPDRIRAGDIVLFDRRNGRYALHRVIFKGRQGFTMAGDNQWHIERNLPYDQIVGVVTTILRDGREIDINKFSRKIRAMAAILAAYPRMYIRKALTGAAKLLRLRPS